MTSSKRWLEGRRAFVRTLVDVLAILDSVPERVSVSDEHVFCVDYAFVVCVCLLVNKHADVCHGVIYREDDHFCHDVSRVVVLFSLKRG